MKTLLPLLIVLCLVGCDRSGESVSHLAPTDDLCERPVSDPQDVSLIALIANPSEFSGKAISVTGFYRLEFEHSAIYLSRDDALNSIAQNGLWVFGGVPETLRNRYIRISGIFNPDSHGHMGQWPASICGVTTAVPWGTDAP
jgi:hypothetical protein